MNEDVGIAWKIQDSDKKFPPKFNLSVNKEVALKSLLGDEKEIKLGLFKQDGGPAGSDYKIAIRGEKNKNSTFERILNVDVEKLKGLEASGYGEVKLELVEKKEEHIGKDASDMAVRVNGTKDYVGRGWNMENALGPKNYVGDGYRNIFDEKGNKTEEVAKMESKSYSLNLDEKKVADIQPDKYGNIRVSMAPMINPPENSNAPNYKVYVSQGIKDKEAEISVRINKEKLMEISPNEFGKIAVVINDKNPKSIQKDKADLTVSELNPGSTDKNYIGGGYTQKPELVKLDKNELSAEGIKKALESNNSIRLEAILTKKPDAVSKEHIELAANEGIQPKIKELVSKAFENKPKPVKENKPKQVNKGAKKPRSGRKI